MIFGMVSTFDRAIGFILLPLTTALMLPKEYGILSLFQKTTDVLQYLVAMGVLTSFFKFYMEIREPKERRQILSASFWQVTALATVAAFIMWPFAQHWNQIIFNGEGLLFPLMTVPATYMAVLISLGDCRLQADGKALTFLFVNILQTITLRGLALLLLFLGWGAAGWVVGQFVGQCMTIIAFAFLAFGGLTWRVEKRWVKTILPYGALLMPLAVSHWVMQGSGTYVINFMLANPLDQIGLYGVGERIAQLMQIFNLAFALGWRRFAFSNIHLEGGQKLLGTGATIFVAASGFIAMGLISLGDDLIRLMIRKEYWAGIPVITPLILAGFFWGITEVLAISCYKVDKPHLLSVTYMSAAGVALVMNFILIPTLGIIGAALAWMTAELVKLVTVWYLGYRHFPLAIEYKRLALALAVYLPLTLFCFFSFPTTTWPQIFQQAGIVACAPLLLVFLGFLKPSEKEALLYFSKKLLRRPS